MAQLLQGLRYKISFTFLPKFEAVEVLILILNISAFVDRGPCCYVVTTPKIGLYFNLSQHLALYVGTQKQYQP